MEKELSHHHAIPCQVLLEVANVFETVFPDFLPISFGATGRQSSLVPGRAAQKWMAVTSSGRRTNADKIASRLRINPEFAAKVYDTLQPSRTVIITDRPVVRKRGKAAVLEG